MSDLLKIEEGISAGKKNITLVCPIVKAFPGYPKSTGRDLFCAVTVL